MRSLWLILVACVGCSSSSTNDSANPSNGGSSSGGSSGASTNGGTGSGGTGSGGTGNGGTGAGGTGGTSSGGSAGTNTGGSGGVAGAVGGASGAAGSMGGGTGGTSCTSTEITINEVATRGATASDEFVELYNAGQSVITLTGYEIKVSDSAGSAQTTIWTGTAADQIVSQGFFVIGGTGFSGADATFNTTNALPNDGGIGITNASVLDKVAWGTLSTPSHPYQEGQPTSNGAIGTSMERSPNGHDCNDNSTDFSIASTPTPDASNNP